jgi:hypothetical protein
MWIPLSPYEASLTNVNTHLCCFRVLHYWAQPCTVRAGCAGSGIYCFDCSKHRIKKADIYRTTKAAIPFLCNGERHALKPCLAPSIYPLYIWCGRLMTGRAWPTGGEMTTPEGTYCAATICTLMWLFWLISSVIDWGEHLWPWRHRYSPLCLSLLSTVNMIVEHVFCPAAVHSLFRSEFSEDCDKWSETHEQLSLYTVFTRVNCAPAYFAHPNF